MDEVPTVWSEEFRVRAYEVDATGNVSVPAIANWLQEVAGNHATALGWAVDALHAKGRTWVLARLHLRLSGMPVWREDVRVSTWPAGVHRVFALREFRIEEKGGREIGVATTGWLLVDLATRRPVRSLEEVEAIARNAPGRVLADPFDRLPEAGAPDSERAVVVRFSDLDMNRHANNVSVIGWTLEALPGDLVLEGRLTELEIEFRAEALHEDRIFSQVTRSAGDAGTFLHRLVRESDGREIARARTLWKSS